MTYILFLTLSFSFSLQAEDNVNYEKQPSWIRLIPSKMVKEIDHVFAGNWPKSGCEKKFANLKEGAKKKIADCEVAFAEQNKIETTIDLYAEPNENSKKLGKIYLRYSPGSLVLNKIPEFQSTYIDTSGKQIDFQPDVLDFRHLYDRYVHHTVLAQHKDWYKLPKDPFPAPVWIRLRGDKKIEIVPIHKAGVLAINTSTFSGDVILEKVDGEFYLGHQYRYPKTNHCIYIDDGDEEEPEEKPLPYVPLKIPLKELFDDNQHLKVKVKSANC